MWSVQNSRHWCADHVTRWTQGHMTCGLAGPRGHMCWSSNQIRGECNPNPGPGRRDHEYIPLSFHPGPCSKCQADNGAQAGTHDRRWGGAIGPCVSFALSLRLWRRYLLSQILLNGLVIASIHISIPMQKMWLHSALNLALYGLSACKSLVWESFSSFSFFFSEMSNALVVTNFWLALLHFPPFLLLSVCVYVCVCMRLHKMFTLKMSLGSTTSQLTQP